MIQNEKSAPNISSKDWWPPLFAAWLISFGASLLALFIGEVMGQVPCQLCWYQRAAMFPLAIVLGLACLLEDRSAWRYALPLAVIGGAVAVWHNLLYFDLVLTPLEPCGVGRSCSSADMVVLGGLPIPILSLIAFIGISSCLWFVKRKATS